MVQQVGTSQYSLNPPSNKMSENKAYLSYAYGRNQVQYYDKFDYKKEKDKKLRKGLILGSVGFVALGSVLLALRSRGVKIKDAKSLFDKVSNLSVNFTNLKDDYWDRFATFLNDKTPLKIVKQAGDKFSDWYRGNVKGALSQKFERAQKAILETEGGEVFKGQFKNYDSMFEDLDKNYKKALKEQRITKGLTQGQDKSKFKNFLNKVTSPIADETLKDVNKKYGNILEIPENASKELKSRIEHYNALQTGSLMPKLRDINCGSAPTDVITMALPIAAFGVGLAKTEDKEKKKSLMLNLGIPLIPTVGMPILGTKFPVLNGFKGMLAGFAVGQLFSQSAKLIDKKLLNKNNEQINKTPV